jgi:hypothetical protein
MEVLSPNYPPVSPQLFIQLLNFLLKLSPKFLIIIEPVSKIVLEHNPAVCFPVVSGKQEFTCFSHGMFRFIATI